LFLVDDLQWADAASLDLLAYIVRHQPRTHLMILGGMRSGEGERADLTHLLAELERLRSLTLIELLSLSAAEVAELAGHYLGAQLETEATQILFAHSEGNPFFAEELLRNWQQMGRLAYTGTGWRPAAQLEETFPAGILRAIEVRLARLPTQTVENLRSAAILG